MGRTMIMRLARYLIAVLLFVEIKSRERLIKVYFRHVGVRRKLQKVLNVQHINNFSPFTPSLP